MKVAIILIALSLSFINCETKKEKQDRSKNSRLNNLYYIFMAGSSITQNTCPPARVFESGTYEISLEKGEALYYDIAARFKAESNNTYGYFIGVSKDQISADIAMNHLIFCNVISSIFNPKPMKTASDTPNSINRSDTDFNYYRYSIFKTDDGILTAKAINKSIKFKLKIPEIGE